MIGERIKFLLSKITNVYSWTFNSIPCLRRSETRERNNEKIWERKEWRSKIVHVDIPREEKGDDVLCEENGMLNKKKMESRGKKRWIWEQKDEGWGRERK